MEKASLPPDEDQADTEGEAPSFFAELKRRKVIRVAVAYAVVSWLIVQIAAATFPVFEIPPWGFRFVVIMLALGFPLALIITWAFELTPDGVVKTSVAIKQRERHSHLANTLNRKRNWLALVFAAALPSIIFGALALFFYVNRVPKQASAVNLVATVAVNPNRPYVIGTIALLPFKLIATGPGIQTTADGLHEEMLTTMSEMGPLNVVSRTSTLSISTAGKDVPEIGAALNADYIIEGSIQPAGSKIRVTLQLIRAANDQHVWADTFDWALGKDPLIFQKEFAYELALRIYQALAQVYPPGGEANLLLERLLTDYEEQITDLRRRFWGATGAEAKLPLYYSLLELCRKALYLKPDFAPAQDAIADILPEAHFNLGLQSVYDDSWRSTFYLVLMRTYVANPEGYHPNYSLGEYYLHFMNDPVQASSYFRKALELYEASAALQENHWHWPYTELAHALLNSGQTQAAIEIIERGPAITEGVQVGVAFDAYYRTRAFDKLNQIVNARPEWQFISVEILTFWSGDIRPLKALVDKAQKSPDSGIPTWLLLQDAFRAEDYALASKLTNAMSMGEHFGQIRSTDMAFYRGWINLMSGNQLLAQSYYKGWLKDLDDSASGKWMQQYQPDVYAATKGEINAYLGERDAALEWNNKALDATAPNRRFSDYIFSLRIIAETYTYLGMYDQASQIIDQLLSIQSGISTGDVMTWPLYNKLHSVPAFEAVIRRHADQLKDPAILNSYFSAKQQ